jgi:hypothetical protein
MDQTTAPDLKKQSATIHANISVLKEERQYIVHQDPVSGVQEFVPLSVIGAARMLALLLLRRMHQ